MWVQRLRVLGWNVEGGFLDRMSLSGHRLWSDTSSPHEWWWVRLSGLVAIRKKGKSGKQLNNTLNFRCSEYTIGHMVKSGWNMHQGS